MMYSDRGEKIGGWRGDMHRVLSIQSPEQERTYRRERLNMMRGERQGKAIVHSMDETLEKLESLSRDEQPIRVLLRSRGRIHSRLSQQRSKCLGVRRTSHLLNRLDQTCTKRVVSLTERTEEH